MEHLWVLVLLFACTEGRNLNANEPGTIRTRSSARQTAGDGDASQTPSNVRIRVGQESVEIHWKAPSEINRADSCSIEYQDSPMWGPSSTTEPTAIRIGTEQNSHLISGLQRDTRYRLRVYCSYGNTRGPETEWVYASTRTVSVDANICSGIIPNAFLEPSCVGYGRASFCTYTCDDGYRISDVAAVLNQNPFWGDSIYIFCRNGTWITNFEKYGHKIQDICLPQAAFEKCPASIPNGRLESHCGPATDWLCNFQCNEGYEIHAFMTETLKGFNNELGKLFCDNGVWKTGYEDVGIDVGGVCVGGVSAGDCVHGIPNGNVRKPCPNGYACSFECTDGYRKRALAGDNWLACNDGEWVVRARKYDTTITPQTVCVPIDVESSCPRNIPNGRISDGCKVDCVPSCNEGYHVLGDIGSSMGPRSVTCENGKWLTNSKPYTGDNICFPEDGMLCSQAIPNGELKDNPSRLKDYGQNRIYLTYQCNEGFRYHRSIPYIECVAGKWKTWNERFGISVANICIPISLT